MVLPTVEDRPKHYHAPLISFLSDQEEQDKFDEMDQARLDYLTDTAAIPTPAAALALWVAVWEAQGGKVYFDNSDYNTVMVTIMDGPLKGSVMSRQNAQKMGIPENLMKTDEVPSYDNFGWTHWTPTRQDADIPEGYGAGALNLFYIVNDSTPKLTMATYDHRKGWEWGHTNVYTLAHDGTKFVADTNQDDSITVPRDVFQMARTETIDSLAARLRGVQKPAVTGPVPTVNIVPAFAEIQAAPVKSFGRRLGKLLGF
jgi:hypothetical protein